MDIKKTLVQPKAFYLAVAVFILFFLFTPKNNAKGEARLWPDNVFVYAYYTNGQQIQCSGSCYYRLTWVTFGSYGPSYSGTVTGVSFPDSQFVQTLTACQLPGGCNSRYLYPGTATGPPGSTFLYASPAIVNWVSGPARVYYYFSAPEQVSTTTITTTTTKPKGTTTTLSPTTTLPNLPPSVSSVTVTEPNYCSSGPSATVSWTFSDPGDSQSAYQVQIDDQSLFNSPEVDSCPGGPPNGTCASGNTSSSYFTGAGILQFNTSYQTRVRVWDSNNTVSPWTEGSICNGPGCAGNGRTWKTPKHAYPQVDFTWTPLSPSANQSVQFTDQSIFYDSGGGSRNWTWTFGDGGSSTQQNPAHTYTTLNNYNINLSVEDKDDYSCSNTKTITVKKPVPFWKEIAPRE